MMASFKPFVVAQSLSTVLLHAVKAAPLPAFARELISDREEMLACLRARDANGADRAMQQYARHIRELALLK